MIKIDNVLQAINPEITLGIIESRVTNSTHIPELWDEIRDLTVYIRKTLSFEGIKDQSQVAVTRKMYAHCGKDPSRYRPSAEALMRRIVRGQDLYEITTLVDIINLVSLRYGFSIGGFDMARIEGNLELGIGRKDEIYNGIGKGVLNIENLPVLRDKKGPIGSPTSDEERTSIKNDTNRLLLVIYAFGGPDGLTECMDYAVDLLKKYAGATEIHSEVVN